MRQRHAAANEHGRRDLARAQRREGLLDAAERAVRQHGPEVSMDVIAAGAGITKPVLYRHFDDRDGLLTAAAARHAERLTADLRMALATAAPPHERLRTTIDTYLSFLERDPALHRALTQVAAMDASLAPLEHALAEVCEEVVEVVARELSGAARDPEPAQVWGEGMVGMVELVGRRWLDDPDGRPRERVVEQLTELLWSGLRGVGTNGSADA